LIQISVEAKDLILKLLTHEPLDRLGAGGALEIKEHFFFNQLHWENLLFRKADFIPQLDGPDDTTYFDPRSDRYNHESFDETQTIGNGKDENNNNYDQNELFASFSSYTSRFQDSLDIASSSCNETSIDEANTSTMSEKSTSNTNADQKSPAETEIEPTTEPVEKEDKTTASEDVAAAVTQIDDTLSTFVTNLSDIEEFVIERTANGYGFTWQEHKVFTKSYSQRANSFVIQHFVDSVDPTGAAHQAGLRNNYMITHVNDKPVSGNTHCELMRLIFMSKVGVLRLRAVQVRNTKIEEKNSHKYVGSQRVLPQKSRGFGNFHVNSNEKSSAVQEVFTGNRNANYRYYSR